jgi:hypothetical protein
MNINSSVPDGGYGNYYFTTPSGGTTKKVVTIKEYDEDGRLVKETVTEETYTPQQYWYQQPSYPYYDTWTTNTGTAPPLEG